MKLDTLLIIHEALATAREHCNGKGLKFVDAEVEVEQQIQLAVDSGQRLCFEDTGAYLNTLRNRGVVT